MPSRREARLVGSFRPVRSCSVCLLSQENSFEMTSNHASYRPDIDGLRAMAIVAVVGYHAYPTLVPGGFVGVDVFFVISGFLIGGIILNGVQSRQFSFANFYARRARRILPALLGVLAVTLVIGVVLLTAIELRVLGSTAAATILGVSNIQFWKGVLRPMRSSIRFS